MRVFIVVLLMLMLLVVDGGSEHEHDQQKQRFDEELMVRRVSNKFKGKEVDTVIGHWQFTTRWWKRDGFEFADYNLFPKQIGQIMDKYKVQELRLSFSKGNWDHENWGLPFVAAPSGVELWAIFKDENVTSIYGTEHIWKRLTRSLAGVTCASLEALDDEMVCSPRRTFHVNGKDLTVRYGQLSSEASCTENLTPWFKLLPCRSKAGLSTLIIPTVVFRAKYHSFSIHVRRPSANSVEQVLSLTVANARVPKSMGLLESFTMKKNVQAKPCPMASGSSIFVQNDNKDEKRKEEGSIQLSCNERARRFDLKRLTMLDDDAFGEETSRVLVQKGERGMITNLKRFATGWGSVEGGLATSFSVHSETKEVLVHYFDYVPSYLRVQPSSIEVTINGKSLEKRKLWDPKLGSIELSSMNGSPTMIELDLSVPPGKEQNVTVSYAFKQTFLPLWVFPPDPNRGFDIPSASISYKLGPSSICKLDDVSFSPLLSRKLVGATSNRSVRIYTESLLVTMPLPDFSMPYNVITLSSTVLAFFFGSIINALVQDNDIVPETLSEEEKSKKKWKGRLKNMFFLMILAIAWVFENERDLFDDWVAKINQALF